MADRYDDNRERFECGRGQGTGRPGEIDLEPQYRGSGQEGREPNWGPASQGRNRGNEGSHGGYQGRNEGSGYRGDEEWPRRENQSGYEQNYQNDEDRYGNQRQYGNGGYNPRGAADRGFGEYGRGFAQGNRGSGMGGGRSFNPGNRGNNQSRLRNSTEGWQRDTDEFMDPGNMATSYPRRNEWSSGSGISTGLGGAENSEYSNYARGGSYYGGQGQFGGGLNQYGEQGRYAGRGPKGYKRSDERIKEDVNERLTQDPHIDANDIEIEVKEGEVTLTGTVESRLTKRRAEDMLESISGVREIHNQLRVQSGREMSTSGSSSGNSSAGSNSGKQSGQTREHAASGSHSPKS